MEVIPEITVLNMQKLQKMHEMSRKFIKYAAEPVEIKLVKRLFILITKKLKLVLLLAIGPSLVSSIVLLAFAHTRLLLTGQKNEHGRG